MIKHFHRALHASVSACGLFAIWSPFRRKPEPVSKYDVPPAYVSADNGKTFHEAGDDYLIETYGPAPINDPQISQTTMTRAEVDERYDTGVTISRGGIIDEVGTVPREVWDGLKPANEA